MIDMQKEEWLSMMLRELPDRLLIVNAAGIIVDGFGGASSSTSLTQSQTINHHYRQLLSQPVADTFTTHLTQALTSGQKQLFHYAMLACDQLQMSIKQLEAWDGEEEKWFEANLKPITLANGAQYVLWQEREITQSYLKQVELTKLAETDELTGILNRRAFMINLERAFNQPQPQALTCLMIDIDHFKEINDQVGHLSGDEVITQVAHLCHKMIRASDYIGRLGGEEFGIVLTDINAIQAYDIAERIRHAIESTPCHVDEHIIYPTVSIGIAELNGQVCSVRELLVQADKAMYYSKQTGRNQVTLYYDNLPTIKTNAKLKAKILKAS